MVYCGLTVIIIVVYAMIGMTALDAVVNGFATVATGGFSPADSSFSKYPGAGEYFGALFMVLSALPYIRFVQLVNGSAGPLWQDLQVRAFLRWLMAAVLAVTAWRVLTAGSEIEPAFRETLFNLTSVMTGTGFFSGTFGSWGGFSMVVAFVAGLVGGCSGSSSGALTVFRVQIALAFLAREIRRISNPSAVDPVKYEGRTVGEDVLNAVVMFVSGYIVIIGLLSTAMTLTGVDTVSAMFGVWQAMGNIGYGFGPLMARTGTFVDFPPTAIAIMTVAMILGRLGLVALLLLLLPAFWRR
jgi:trk system potassium uptake protein TrkH